ncbi:alpha/beta hydrolase family protein [Niallia oryzisoli]|uniref:alpha/beta hydrolase family protein n=1 Tax=Niallia oryzisoli TaxID=1737571 RepID=UPI0037362491
MKKLMISTLTAITLLTGAISASAQEGNGKEVPIETSIKSEQALVNLPKTTGEYKVGSTTYDWVDTSRKDLLDPKNKRELKVQVWYPSDKASSKGKKKEPYLPMTEKGINQIISTFSFGELFADVNDINTQVYKDGRLSTKEKIYPVVLFSHGLGVSNWNYQWLTRELASQGFIVVSIDHSHFSFGTEFQDGRFIPTASQFLPGNSIPQLEEYDDYVNNIWVKDIQFVIKKLGTLNKKDKIFKNKLDLKNIAAVGHSMGGAAAARALQVEPKIKSAINIDGSFMGLTDTETMTKPFAFIKTEMSEMFLTGKVEQPLPPGLDPQTEQELREMFHVYNDRYKQVVTGPAYDITIYGGAIHNSFTDMPLLRPYLSGTMYDNDSIFPANPEPIYEVTNRVIVDFLEKTLNGKKKTILDRKNFNIPNLKIEQ